MNITVTDQEQCRKQLRLEIPGETVRAETDKIAADLARKVNVPGFRRGHVPKSVVKTRFRKELRDEMLSQVLPHSLGNAIKEKELKVIGEPSVEDLKFKDDESIDVVFNVEVAPEFVLSNYKQLPLTKPVYIIRDEDIDKTIEHLRDNHAQLVPVEDRGAQAGDLVTVNLAGKLAAQTTGGEDKAGAIESEEIKQDDLNIELGADGVLKEFTEGLAGVKPGDLRTFSVDYPADYKPEKFAGHSVTYTAEVTVVRTRELPEIDDDFASTVNPELKTMDDLRADVRSKLEHEAEHRADAEFRSSTLEKLIDRNRFDVPEFVVEKQMDSRMNTLFRQMSGRGMDPRTLKVDWEGIREGQREKAEREVRGSFILDRIAEIETIEVSDEELNNEVKQYADNAGQSEDVLRARLTKDGSLDSIREQVRNRKALDLVIASAEIQTEEKQGLSDEAAAERGQTGGQE